MLDVGPRAPTVTHTVLLVDDQPAFLELARSILQGSARFQVIGHAANGEEALRLLPALRPDLVIMDVIMPGMSGFKLAQRLREVSPALKMVLVSATDDPLYARLAETAGALGFVGKKRFSPEAISALLERAL